MPPVGPNSCTLHCFGRGVNKGTVPCHGKPALFTCNCIRYLYHVHRYLRSFTFCNVYGSQASTAVTAARHLCEIHVIARPELLAWLLQLSNATAQPECTSPVLGNNGRTWYIWCCLALPISVVPSRIRTLTSVGPHCWRNDA